MVQMNPSNEQLQIAAQLDADVERLVREGSDEVGIVVGMADSMPSFKRLLDTPAALGELCGRFPGLMLYAKILEKIAQGLKDGTIKPPR